MPNDDLGQFPMPQTVPTTPSEPEPPQQVTPIPPVPEFEETPEEVPSPTLSSPVTESPSITTEAPPPPAPDDPFITSFPKESPTQPQTPPAPNPMTPPPPVPIEPLPAVAPPSSSGSSFRTIIFSVLFLTAIGGLAAAAFLYQQTSQLRSQLATITQTLNQQRTQPAITPTPTIIEIPGSPSVTPTATVTAIPSPTQVIPVTGSPLKPLSIAANILKIGIDYQPNAQLILLKTDNANNAETAITKYFFRQDLNTKKYFYVLVSGTSQPEIIDKNIQVSPDNNIPSLNNLVLQNNLGIDLDEALKIVYSKCSDQTVCKEADTRAQYIQTSSGVIWQVSLFVAGKTQPMVMQINSQTKAIIFRTADFIAD